MIIKNQNQSSSNAYFRHLPPNSLYRLVWRVIFVVTLLPAIAVIYLLLDKMVQQSQTQILKGLTNNIELYAELLEKELNVQVNALKQLSRVVDVTQTPTSSVFGFNAEEHLKNFIAQSPRVSGSYILNRAHHLVEGYPKTTESVDLTLIGQHLEQYLTLAQKLLIANGNPDELTPYLFSIQSEEMVKQLVNHKDEIVSDWVIVMILPLIQHTRQAKIQFQVVGSLVALEPYQQFVPLLKKWTPKDGNIELFQGDTVYFQLQRNDKAEQTTKQIAWVSSLEAANKKWQIRISQPSDTLLSIMFAQLWHLGLAVILILLLSTLTGLMFTRKIGVQLFTLTDLVKAFAQGNYHQQISGLYFSEFIQISAVLQQLSQKVLKDQSKLEATVEERSIALRETNRQLSTTLNALRQTQNQLVEKEKMAALGQLVSGIANELDTPLTICAKAAKSTQTVSTTLATMVTSNALKKNELTQQLAILGEATDQLNHNIRLSSKLVRYFKELSPDAHIEKVTQFELKGFLQELSHLWLSSYPLDNVEVMVTGYELNVHTYMGTLIRVVEILFNNVTEHAIKEMAHTLVELSIFQAGNNAVLKFCDNGTGVDIEPVSRIFEPFYTSKRHTNSTGLGLHLAYNMITQRLKGSITAQNRPQGGLEIQNHIPTHLIGSKPPGSNGKIPPNPRRNSTLIRYK